MSIVIRPPTDEEWADVCYVDGRAFGVSYTPEQIEERRPVHDMSRFRAAVDGGRFVSIAGSYALEVTLPGGAAVPMGGVTWVSTVATHRRQGLMTRTIDAIHDDIDARGEPVASLYASEGSIYERLGYGVSTLTRLISLAPRLTALRHEFRQPRGSVRYISGVDEVIPIVTDIWDRFHRLRAGEIANDALFQNYLYSQRAKPQGDISETFYLAHRDGYVAYRVEPRWNDGHPAHTLQISELAAVTPDAHAALWQTLLEMDLIGEITSRQVSIDDPLPYLLENPRALRTTGLNDGVWVNVRDVAIAFGARTYRTDDRIVVESDGVRWAIEGGPEGGNVRRVRTKADLVTSHAGLSALLYGGIAPSSLVAGRRMTARSPDVLTRADLFFLTALAPHCQSGY